MSNGGQKSILRLYDGWCRWRMFINISIILCSIIRGFLLNNSSNVEKEIEDDRR